MSHWHEETLPEQLPESPMELAHSWFRAAIDGRIQPNPDAMVLATADRSGNPSARVVLCKQLVVAPGYLVFFTNYDSRKGRELTERPSAAAVFHWDSLRRQMRVEGTVVRSPDEESDDYFVQRAWQSRIGAWASRQSQPIASRELLLDKVGETAAQFGADFEAAEPATEEDGPQIPRPAFWGGFRLWISRMELWTEGAGRVHDRALWERDLARTTGDRFEVGPWRCSRLQP